MKKRYANTPRYDETKMAAMPPVILGPPKTPDCDHCGEPAEHHVAIWPAVMGGVKVGDKPGTPVKPWIWDLCGTCLLKEKMEAKLTYEEHTAFWDKYKRETNALKDPA